MVNYEFLTHLRELLCGTVYKKIALLTVRVFAGPLINQVNQMMNMILGNHMFINNIMHKLQLPKFSS